ncbi:NEDD8-activating enzyme E1 catalytic subunit [Nilaparvata lugens]|uniref:NEDD8-activating enzyme E1 catalytic subunit n=1 Tax=Nilaparvata lugens TaxID=108931 RepID=UPI00193C88CD|nr:NEDD8-activating enzyme E1 catalytic subunit [Nilaparvata lugens]
MDETVQNKDAYPKRWCHLKKVLERTGPFCHPDFEPSIDVTNHFIMTTCKILVIGAGGLGCELLKNLALMGFKDIHVIDMDTIDLSNLNRQFLFRRHDIGQSKAEVAAKFINERIPGCRVTPHYCKIQDFDESFYRQFHIVVCGLDSIVARRWINGMLISLLNYDDDGDLDQSSIIPMVDGGTEGFKGNVRVILPGISACIECTLDLFPPQVSTHKKLKNFRLVQGVVKNIIPAVASTNAAIAAACTTEVFKIATSCSVPLSNYMVFNDVDGLYTYTYEAEKKEDCLACGQTSKVLEIKSTDIKLQQLIDLLSEQYQMKNPGVTMSLGGKNRTLYLPTVASIEEQTRENLKKSLGELGLGNGGEINVADVTSPNTLVFVLRVASGGEGMQVE